jgi:hypothetical protein
MVSVDDRILLKWILRQSIYGLHERQGIAWLAERLLAS